MSLVDSRTRTKDPKAIKRGRAGSLVRWGDDPKRVRLDDLTPDQRRLVLALVEAARSENEQPLAAEPGKS